MHKVFGSVAELPQAVRERLSPPEQAQWLEVFNSVFESTEGTEQEKEAAAFTQANGVIAAQRDKRKRRTGGVRMGFDKLVPIEKIDDEQRIVWGWAYVCEERGGQVVDHSGQVVDPDDMQKAAHGFVLDSRMGGVMHEQQGGSIVDSMFFSKDVQRALGVDLGKVGWFIGFHVDDDEAWQGVKSGKYKAFSIGGSADVEGIGDDASNRTAA